jgi:hypothetical protein
MVVRTVRHAGMLHFVIDSADGTRGLLPEWMTEPEAAELPLVASATLSVAALRDLRATIDARRLSSATLSGTQEKGDYVSATPRSSTKPPPSGSGDGPAREAAARSPDGSSRSIETAPDRDCVWTGKDEAGR